MAAVLFCPLSVVQEAVDQIAGTNSGLCEVTNVNAPSQVVVSGEIDQLKRLQSVLHEYKDGKRARVRLLHVNYPFHSSCLKAASAELENYAQAFICSDPQIPILSNVDGSLVSPFCLLLFVDDIEGRYSQESWKTVVIACSVGRVYEMCFAT